MTRYIRTYIGRWQRCFIWSHACRACTPVFSDYIYKLIRDEFKRWDARLHIYKNLKILIKYHFIYFPKYVFFIPNIFLWRAIPVSMGFHNDSHWLGRLFSVLEARGRRSGCENGVILLRILFLSHLTTFSWSGGRVLRALPCLLRVLGPWDQWSNLTIFFLLTTCSQPLTPNPLFWREGEVAGAAWPTAPRNSPELPH